MKGNLGIQFRNEYFLFLLPLFFILHGYTENFPLINKADAFFLLAIYLMASIFLALLFFLFFKSFRRAAIFTMLLLSFQFFFGSMHDAVTFFLPNSFIIKYIFIIPLVLIVFSAGIRYFKKSKRPFNRFTRYVNVLFLILLLIDFIQLVGKIYNQPQTNNDLPAIFSGCDTCSKPDIYFIVADEYAGKKELQDIFKFDNSSFENKLKQSGFFIIDSSVSNYNYTPFSIASILSMNYLTGIEGRNTSKSDRHICYALINKNPVINFFRLQGYQFKNFSVFQFDNKLPGVRSSFILTGKDILTSQTFLSRLERDIRFNLITQYKIKSEIKSFANAGLSNVEYLFNETKEEVTRKTDHPRFIYTHLMMPHYPYFFDKNGKRTDPEIALEGNQVKQKEYIEYLQYSNKKFIELFDYILSNSKKPPVIIFMADHGFRHFTKEVDHKYYFMNFNAVYLPDKRYEKFYKTMSAVNEFRVVFNSQFNQQLPLLKDSTSYLTE